MTLADFTSPGLIIPHLSGDEAASAIKELAEALKRENRVPDVLPFYQDTLNREFLVSTDMEGGMAFPHARVPGLTQLSFAVGRCEEPIRWGPEAARSVELVFLIAVPATDATQYLRLISGLARLSKDEGLMARLHAANDPAQILEVLRQIAVRTRSAFGRLDQAETGINI